MIKKIEIILRKLLLQLLLLGKSEQKSNAAPKLDSNSKILFIRLNRIGDALVSTPLIREVKIQLRCKISVLADRKNYFIFNNLAIADEVIVLNKKASKFRKLISKLNSENFDAVIDLHDDVSTTVSYITAFLNIPVKIGFRKGNEKIYSHLVEKLDPQKYHVVNRILEFGKFLNLKLDIFGINIFYRPDESSISLADNFIVRNFHDKKFLIGINISAGSEARFWGVDKYLKLIQRLNKYDLNILVMCVEKDLKKALEISNNRLPVFYRNNFDEFAAMISRLNLLFTPDTSIVHLASAFEIPMFGIYVKYQTNDVIWYPYKSDYDCVITEEPTLEKLLYNEVENKFLPFLVKHLHGKRNS